MNCIQCNRVFSREDCIASISGSIFGDECTESYFFCVRCGVYTKEIFWDCFSGEESVSVSGPIMKADGDAKVAQIGNCSEPWNKKCRCEAHRSYFNGSLD
ncbi:MAG TPA: hypothetical protein PLO63_08925 [Syntrophales bacterium]|jgi:hypothetical protein|nr:hypothetical protein [Syntrophales bacterium]